MQSFKNLINQIRAAAVREEGQGTVEYVMVSGIVILAVVAAASGALEPAIEAIVDSAEAAITGAF